MANNKWVLSDTDRPKVFAITNMLLAIQTRMSRFPNIGPTFDILTRCSCYTPDNQRPVTPDKDYPECEVNDRCKPDRIVYYEGGEMTMDGSNPRRPGLG